MKKAMGCGASVEKELELENQASEARTEDIKTADPSPRNSIPGIVEEYSTVDDTGGNGEISGNPVVTVKDETDEKSFLPPLQENHHKKVSEVSMATLMLPEPPLDLSEHAPDAGAIPRPAIPIRQNAFNAGK
eukprot:TRINITY_DN35394_c0_g1_i1.p1 TRINITY_DN35394_c0_g1~~TRINITY_DN35394_c0_g1_i1.p1  ORF type:complete len:132 (+),score=28.66 TRINITY_DN35394_c0_g1_i1:34-429(+)